MAEAMQLIDDHEYGKGIFTRDGEAARYFTDDIKVGMFGPTASTSLPTDGVRECAQFTFPANQ